MIPSSAMVWSFEPILLSSLSSEQRVSTLLLFSQAVWDFYRQHGRPFPWRETCDPYAVLLSELMLQQTQIKTVLPYFNRFIKRFPDVKILSEADEEEVFSYIKLSS